MCRRHVHRHSALTMAHPDGIRFASSISIKTTAFRIFRLFVGNQLVDEWVADGTSSRSVNKVDGYFVYAPYYIGNRAPQGRSKFASKAFRTAAKPPSITSKLFEILIPINILLYS